MSIPGDSAEVPDTPQNGKATSTPAKPQPVILVHGTGSAVISDDGVQWWQKGSDFSTTLDQHLYPLAQCLASGELFHWSGTNSEKDRRLFGVKLLDRLRRFEEQGRDYHLVGHSHGGSVIMAALIEGTRQNLRLSHLRSWSTIGTPFLGYKASAWNKSGLLPLLTGVLAMIWLLPLTSEYLGRRADLVQDKVFSAVLLPPVLLTLPLLLTGFLGLIWAIAVVRRRKSAKHEILLQKVVLEYGERWLGIASSADEAINGLGSTLTLRSNVAWRIPQREVKKRWLAAVFSPLRLLVRFYNTVIAAAADEFVWAQVNRRLQGSDIRGYVLATVSRGLRYGARDVIPLDPAVEGEIVAQANTHAGRTLGSVRNVLGLASQSSNAGNRLLAGFQESLTWNELVHTSYMMFPAVRERIAAHIMSRIERAPLTGQSDSIRDPSPPKQPAIPSLPKLSLVSNMTAAALIGILTQLAALVCGTLIGPYTNDYQIQAIWKQLSDPELRNPHGASSGLASLLAAHVLLVGDGTDDASAMSIVSPHTRHLAIQRVAEAHVLTNDMPRAQKLIQALDDPASLDRARVALYAQLALSGNCAVAEKMRSSAIEAGHKSGDVHLLLLAARALKECKDRDQALQFVNEARKIASAKPWDADDLSSSVAALGEEAATEATIADFSKPSEIAHQAISAATVFMKQGNVNVVRTLLSKVDLKGISSADSRRAMKLFARLGDMKSVDALLSGNSGLLSCSALTELGNFLASEQRTNDVLQVEQLMVAQAEVIPVPSRIAECLFDVSLLQEQTGDSARAQKAFEKAVELTAKVADDEGVRADLLVLAAEVTARSNRQGKVEARLRNARIEANKLAPTQSFETLMRLARVGLDAGTTDELRAIVKDAGEAIARDTEYQSRSAKYRRLSSIYAEAGWYRNARLLAERCAISDDRLEAYALIVWYVRGHDAPRLQQLAKVVKDDDGLATLTDLDSYEKKRAETDEKREELRLILRPVCPAACSISK